MIRNSSGMKKQKGGCMSKEDLGVCDSCVVLHVAVVDT